MGRRKNRIRVPAIVALIATLTLCAAVAAYVALYPSADGTVTFADDPVFVDASHTDQGYVMVRHQPTQKAIKLRIIKGKTTYTYDLNTDNEYETFPLPLGSGKYSLQVFKQVSGKKYTRESSYNFNAELTDDTLPFLYPNQYIWYTADSAAVQKAAELCDGLETATDKVTAIRQYIDRHITYDYALAMTVKSGYVPAVDDVLSKGRGICFDYAALLACMLRTQGVPVKLVIGYADQSYHAWNNVLVDGQWYRVDTTAEANGMKVAKYTEERVY